MGTLTHTTKTHSPAQPSPDHHGRFRVSQAGHERHSKAQGQGLGAAEAGAAGSGREGVAADQEGGGQERERREVAQEPALMKHYNWKGPAVLKKKDVGQQQQPGGAMRGS